MTIGELRAILEEQDKGVLIDFLIEEVKGDAILLNHVLTEFTDDWLDEECFGDRQRWLHAVLKDTEIDWYGDCVPSESAQEALALFYRQVDRAITIGRFKEAVALLLIADEEVGALDDYGVDTGALLDEVSKRFDAIANAVDDERRSELFSHVVQTYPDESRCRRLAFALSRGADEWATLSALVLDDPYDQKLAFELLLKSTDRAEQEAFLFEKDVGPDIWERAVRDANDSGEWERAIRYCQEAMKRFSGWDVWKDLLLEAYKGSGKNVEAQELAFDLASRARLGYTALKALVPPQEWRETVEKLCHQLEQKGRTCDNMLIAEERFDLLIAHVQRFPFLVLSYWEVLKEEYREELITLVASRSSNLVNETSPREEFVHLAKLLGILKSLGEEKTVERRIASLLKRYPSKRMLKEELKQAGLIE